MLESKNVFDINFNDIRKVNDKYNSKKAILKKLTIEHVTDQFEYDRMGVVAKAEINIPFKVSGYNKDKAKFEEQTTYKIQTISSGGLWGVSVEEEQEYLEEIEQEQIYDLLDHLKVLNVATDLYNG